MRIRYPQLLPALLCFVLMLVSTPLESGAAAIFQSSAQRTSDYSGQGLPLAPEQLQSLVAPIALYPDPLVAQILGGATYPDQVVAANDFVQHKGLAGHALMEAVTLEPWDPSVTHCWRCRTPLIYWGKPSWYIATSTRKNDLLAANATVDWHPATSGTGASASGCPTTSTGRCRVTATGARPCPSGAAAGVTCAASGRVRALRSVRARRHRDRPAPAHHRRRHLPVFDLRRGGGEDDELSVYRRVEPVIDAWFDSGSMPAAQVGYPHVPDSKEAFTFPADFISEAIDQTGAGSTRSSPSTRSCSARAPTATSCAWATSSTPTAAKCRSRSATSSTPGRSSTPGAPTPCAGGCSRQGSPWTPTRATLGRSTRRCGTCCSRCGTRSASSRRTRR